MRSDFKLGGLVLVWTLVNSQVLKAAQSGVDQGAATRQEATSPTNTTSPEVPVKKNQLEELFIWKLSDELKLSSLDEKKFADLIRILNKRKVEESKNVDARMKEFIAAKSDREREKNLSQLKAAYQKYNEIPIEEINSMKKLLGTQKLAQYFEIKQELSAKVKSLIIENEKKEADKKSLPTPRVIEEKK